MNKILLPVLFGIFAFALIWGFSGVGDDSTAKAKPISFGMEDNGGRIADDSEASMYAPKPVKPEASMYKAEDTAEGVHDTLAQPADSERKPAIDTLREDNWMCRVGDEDELAADSFGDRADEEDVLSPVHDWIANANEEETELAADVSSWAKPTAEFMMRVGGAVPDEILFSLTLGAAKPTISFQPVATGWAKPTIKFDENENRFPKFSSISFLHAWMASGGGCGDKAISFGVENSWAKPKKPTVIMIKADDDETRTAFFGAESGGRIAEDSDEIWLAGAGTSWRFEEPLHDGI